MRRPALRTLYLLKRAEALARAGIEDALRELAVTPGQYTTMALLKTQREISSAELARRVSVTPQSISETIAVLERKGLIARSESPANKRILRIGITPAGAALLKVCDGRVDRFERSLLARLDAGQLSGLREALAAIVQSDRPG